MPGSPSLPRGARFADRFEIVREVAPVFGGQDYAARRDGDDAAGRLTILAPALAGTELDRSIFLAQTRRAQRVEDGAIVPLIAAGIDEATGAPWAYAPWVQGSPLADLMRARGRLSHATVRALLEPLVEALGRAHAGGVVHGAISPATLYLEPPSSGPERLRLLRTGVERFAAERSISAWLSSPPDRDWLAPAVAGGIAASQDRAWLAPEAMGVVLGGVSAATDVRAVALLAFYLLSGRAIFDEAEVSSLSSLLLWLHDPPPRPSERWRPTRDDERSGSGLPPGFDDWLIQCADRAPTRRPADVRAAWRSLADLTWARTPSPAPPRPAPPSPAMSEEVPSGEWPEVAAAALPEPVEQWSDGEGGAHVSGGGVEVVLFPARGLVQAAGIDWYVRSILPRRALQSVLEGIARVAALLRAAPRLGERSFVTRPLLIRRFKEALEQEDVPSPPSRGDRWRPEPPPLGVLCATLDGDGLDAMVTDEAWVTSHQLGVVGSTFARIPRAQLPGDRETFGALITILREIAPSTRDRPLWICDYCGCVGPPLHMHSRTACHRCAETHLGVLH